MFIIFSPLYTDVLQSALEPDVLACSTSLSKFISELYAVGFPVTSFESEVFELNSLLNSPILYLIYFVWLATNGLRLGEGGDLHHKC